MQKIKIILASPRGFCAGVKRAIEIVELAIQEHGAPIYVRHEIVHNKRVVEDLKKKGAIFVEELDQIPTGAKVIFSAHGVSTKVKEQAKKLNQLTLDATCPLVSKVHQQTKNYDKKKFTIILIGHRGHPEVEGIKGQIKNKVVVIENEDEALALKFDKDVKLAYVTQTTLSLDDTRNIISVLKNKFPKIEGPQLQDICYATQNRQVAVSKLADLSDLVLVVGGENSSNTKRLAEIVEKKGVEVYRVSGVKDLQQKWFVNKLNIGITAGASSPEILVEEIINFLKESYLIKKIETIQGVEEKILFKPVRHFS